MHFISLSKSLKKKVAPCTACTLDDERVICSSCAHACKVEVCEFVHLKNAKELKAKGRRVGMVGDKQEVVRGWLKLSWQELHCKATGLPALPKDVPHHCQLYSSAILEPVSVESDWWVT